MPREDELADLRDQIEWIRVALTKEIARLSDEVDAIKAKIDLETSCQNLTADETEAA